MRRLLLLLILGLSACADLPMTSAPAPAGDLPDSSSQQGSAETDSESREAVQALVTSSRSSRASGDYALALADVERAIRIEPRNPYLWLELGEIHLSRNDPGQAAAMARKAASVAGPDRAAKAAAERLLEKASRQ